MVNNHVIYSNKKDSNDMDRKNKETINLLDFLSESDSELSDLLTTAKKKKVKRKHQTSNLRNSGLNKKQLHCYNCNCNKSKSQMVVLCLSTVLVTIWLIALSYLAAVLYGEIGKMDLSIKDATANIKVVTTSFYEYQTRVNNLNSNQTNVYIKLNNVTAQISNLTLQLSNIQRGLSEVQQSIHDNPALNKAINLSYLIEDIGKSRIKIDDLQAEVTGLKDSKLKLESTQTVLQQNLTDIKNSLLQLSEVRKTPSSVIANDTLIKVEELSRVVSQVMINVSSINETLSAQFKGIQEDQSKDLHLLNSLRDSVDNATTKVISLERQCAKESAQEQLRTIVNQLVNDMKETNKTSVSLTEKVHRLETDNNSLIKPPNVLSKSDDVNHSESKNPLELFDNKETNTSFQMRR